MLPTLEAVREIVRTAAREELLPRFADVLRHAKHDGSVVTAADLAMQHRLQIDLARRWPEYDFLGEEMPATEHEALAAGQNKGLWCVDPLDGTSNYASGIPIFAVSLALLIDSQPQIGLVYDPLRDECFMAEKNRGAWLNNATLTAPGSVPEALCHCIAVVDFKRLMLPLAAKLGAQPPYGSQRNFGSSCLEWCWLAASRFHLYLHGGQKLWDYAAGSLILAEAGGQAATLDGEEIFTLGMNPRSVVAAARPDLFPLWKSWIDQNRMVSD